MEVKNSMETPRITRRDLFGLLPAPLLLLRRGNPLFLSPPGKKEVSPRLGKKALEEALSRDREENNRRYLALLGFGLSEPEKGPLLGWQEEEYPDPRLSGTPQGALQVEKAVEGRKQWRAFLKATGSVEGRVVNRWVRRYPGIIYAPAPPGRTFPPPALHAMFEHIHMEMNPSLLAVLVGSTVDFINRDDCRDNIMSKSPTATFSHWFTGADQLRTQKFDKPGVVPLLCQVHPDEWGTVVVVSSPFFSLTDKRGRFRIPHLPPGEWTLNFWHPKLKPARMKVEVKAGGVTQVTFRRLKRKR